MSTFRVFSAAALLAVLAVGTVPALAQTRDTRPDRPTTEPERPRMDHGDGDSDVDDGPLVDASLPTIPFGFECTIDESGTPPHYAYVVNNTGKIVPHGTVITWYVQPGNIMKTYKIEIDWLPGHSIWIPDADNAIKTLPAFCSISLWAPREDPNLSAGDPMPDGPTIMTKRQLREQSNRPIGLKCEMKFIAGKWVPVVTYEGPAGLVGGPQTLTIEEQPGGTTLISQIYGEWEPGTKQSMIDWPGEDDPYSEPPTCTAVAK